MIEERTDATPPPKHWEQLASEVDWLRFKYGTIIISVPRTPAATKETLEYMRQVCPSFSRLDERENWRIGGIDIDPEGEGARRYLGTNAQSGEVHRMSNIHGALISLYRETQEALLELGRLIRENPESPIAQFDYLVGVTRLAPPRKDNRGGDNQPEQRKGNRLERIGFEVFDLGPGLEGVTWASHRSAAKIFEDALGLGRIDALRLAHRKPPRFAVISKGAIIELR